MVADTVMSGSRKGLRRRSGAATDTRAGEVPEWSNGTVSKTVVRVTVPWVRIPPSPPASLLFLQENFALWN
jgi:hypothetical protein